MKKLLLILLCLPMIGFGQQTYVPDDIFEQYLINLGYDNILDDSVITSDMNTVVYINVSNTNVSSLVGIEDCISLTHLECDDSNISSLDLSNNLLLEYLECDDINLGVLDITSNTLLQELNCSNANLSSLNLSNNLDLEILNCSNNGISTLDISNNSSLTRLTCSENNLTEINLINNTALEFLSCIENSIDTLKVIANPLIKTISASRNGMKNIVLNGITLLNSLYLNENQLTNIDISNALFSGFWPEFDCSNNPQLNELDLRNGANNYFDLNSIFCPNLTCINVHDTLFAVAQVINGDWIIDSQQNFSVSCGAIFGCTDSLSCNYDSFATIDDSSCVYLDIIAVATSVSCFGMFDGSIMATATGGILPFQYSLGGGLSQASGTFSNLGAGTHYIDVTDINGCTSNESVTITEPTSLSISVDSTDETSALGDGSATAIINGGVPPYFYTWNTGSSGLDDYLIDLLSPGLYTVQVTDSNGCIISDSTFVNAYISTGFISIKEISKTLVKITDMLGQETPYRRNTPLFYIYDDGTVEKRIVIE